MLEKTKAFAIKYKTPLLIAGAAILIWAIWYFSKDSSSDSSNGSSNKSLAKCLKDKGAKFYGASWCPHCINQKATLGNSSDIPYVECSGPNRTQVKECIDAKITGYPTWTFKDGSRVPGEMTADQLKAKVGC